MDIKLLAAYQAVYQDLSHAIGFDNKAVMDALRVILQRQFELENWDNFISTDEVPD